MSFNFLGGLPRVAVLVAGMLWVSATAAHDSQIPGVDHIDEPPHTTAIGDDGVSAPASSVGAPCDACDTNCDAFHDTLDIQPFVDTLLQEASACSPCGGDLDASGFVDGRDMQPFIDCLLTPPPIGACCSDAQTCALTTEQNCVGVWLGEGSTCLTGACAFAGLTAYRPQHGAGYFPLAKTAVTEADEENASTGPGIRINAPGDSDPSGEDDLIELFIENARPEVSLVLRRTNSALRLWTTRTKLPGTEVAFTNDTTDALVLTGGTTLTLWVEWAEVVHGVGDLRLEPLDGAYSLDTLRFHTFQSIVMALGGEDQVPSVPVDPNNGTAVVATALYGKGYDVHLYDEDNVSPNGSGIVLNEVVTAVGSRLVDEVSIFGYSHGGGSTYDLAERLDNDRPGIGLFEIEVTSYVDGVENDSDFDVSQERRRPPSTAYHANHYQVGTLGDFFLDGGPVPSSDPPPSGLNVETTPWGAGATHFLVDDYVQVRSFIESNLVIRLTP